MKKIFITLEIIFPFFILGCTPGLSFYIENRTTEPIEIDFSICDDLLGSEIEKTCHKTLENGELLTVFFAVPSFFNRGVTAADLFYTETFLSVFENITIKFQSSGIILKKDDLKQYEIEYKKEPTASIFILVIEEKVTVGHARVSVTRIS
jgi:hypothetical protein